MTPRPRNITNLMRSLCGILCSQATHLRRERLGIIIGLDKQDRPDPRCSRLVRREVRGLMWGLALSCVEPGLALGVVGSNCYWQISPAFLENGKDRLATHLQQCCLLQGYQYKNLEFEAG